MPPPVDSATPPPVAYTYSVSLVAPDLEIIVWPGKHSAPVRQVVKNSGNLMLAAVELAATPWRGGGDSGGAVLVGLHTLATEASVARRGIVYSTLGGGPAVAASGLEGGDAA